MRPSNRKTLQLRIAGRFVLVWAALALFSVGCSESKIDASSGPVEQALATNAVPQYTVDSGDRLRIVVFGEADLSGEFEIDSAKMLSMPLIGQVRAGGLTISQLENTLLEHLRGGYLKDPRVSIEVLNYRPFFILGEVNKPGSYPFINGMSVLNAIALSGGYTYRGSKERTLIIRGDDPTRTEMPASESTMVRPGDTIRVRERYF